MTIDPLRRLRPRPWFAVAGCARTARIGAVRRAFRRNQLDTLPPARRLWPTTAEAAEIRRSFLLGHPDGLELVLSFADGGPAYAAQIDPNLVRPLLAELERCMTAIEPLIADDVHERKTT